LSGCGRGEAEQGGGERSPAEDAGNGFVHGNAHIVANPSKL
jgi:hypothetical protein